MMLIEGQWFKLASEIWTVMEAREMGGGSLLVRWQLWSDIEFVNGCTQKKFKKKLNLLLLYFCF